jgi:hypothetical protein
VKFWSLERGLVATRQLCNSYFLGIGKPVAFSTLSVTFSKVSLIVQNMTISAEERIANARRWRRCQDFPNTAAGISLPVPQALSSDNSFAPPAFILSDCVAIRLR